MKTTLPASLTVHVVAYASGFDWHTTAAAADKQFAAECAAHDDPSYTMANREDNPDGATVYRFDYTPETLAEIVNDEIEDENARDAITAEIDGDLMGLCDRATVKHVPAFMREATI